MAVMQRRTLIDRIRDVFGNTGSEAAAAAGVFRVSGSTYYNATGWEFTRIANSVYANPTGYRCIEAIVANFSRPQWEIRDAADPSRVIPDHRLLKVLNQPSSRTSGTMMQRTIARDLEMMGKSFWLKMQGTDGFGMAGPVTGLRRLPPQRVTVVGNQDDELLGFIYTDRAGRREPMLPEMVVYLRFPHPERDFDGLPPAVMAGLPAEADTAAARFNYDLLSNDAALPGYVSVEGLTRDQFAEWKAAWEAGEVPGKTRFLGGKVEYTKVGQTNQELMYGEMRRQMEDDILRSFGVPRAVAFDVEDTTYANADAEKAMFMQQNILPKWVLTGDELTIQLGMDERVIIGYRMNEIDELQEAPNQVVDRLLKLLYAEAVTINHVNNELGLPSVPWGDYPVQPVGAMKPLPAAAPPPGGGPTQAPPASPATADPNRASAFLAWRSASEEALERAMAKQEQRAQRQVCRFVDRQSAVVSARLQAGKGKNVSRLASESPWFDLARWDLELQAELEDLYQDTVDGLESIQAPGADRLIERAKQEAGAFNRSTEADLRLLSGTAGSLDEMVGAVRDYFTTQGRQRAEAFAGAQVSALIRELQEEQTA